MVVVQIPCIAWASRTVGISWEVIECYVEIGMITLGCVAAISSIGATVFTPAIRTAARQAQRADAANTQLERANTDLEAKVRERTLALMDANVQLAHLMGAREHEIATVIHDLGHGASMLMGVVNTTLIDVELHGAPKSVMEAAWHGLNLERHHYERIVEDLRDAVRLQHHVLVLHPEAVHLTALLDEVVTTVQMHEASQLVPGMVTLHVDGIPPAVWVDPDRLRRVLYNLVDNAWRYSCAAESGPHVAIRLQAKEEVVEMTITGNGHGMASQDLQRLGQRLQRRASDPQGMGIGLHFCQQIMVRSGGTLTITSPGLHHGPQSRSSSPALTSRGRPPHPRTARNLPQTTSRRLPHAPCLSRHLNACATLV